MLAARIFSLSYLTFMKKKSPDKKLFYQFCNLTSAMTECISTSLFCSNLSGNGLTNHPRKALVSDTNMLTGSSGLDKVWSALDMWDKTRLLFATHRLTQMEKPTVIQTVDCYDAIKTLWLETFIGKDSFSTYCHTYLHPTLATNYISWGKGQNTEYYSMEYPWSIPWKIIWESKKMILSKWEVI